MELGKRVNVTNREEKIQQKQQCFTFEAEPRVIYTCDSRYIAIDTSQLYGLPFVSGEMKNASSFGGF